MVLAAVAGPDPADPSSAEAPEGLSRVGPEIPPGLRVAVLGFPDRPPVEPAAREAFAAARQVFRGAGAVLEEAELPDLPYEALAGLFIEAEAATAFEDLIRTGRTRELSDRSHADRRPEDYLPRALASDYVRAMRLRGEVQRALAAFFERHDLLVAPNLPYPPPRVEENFDALFSAPDPLGAAGNLAGLPATAVPMGFANGLPLSLQIVGPAFEDARVLSAAAFFQSRTRFHLERPPDPPAAVTVR
jgi:aspartyl-tRNA(Asn)/glutamyl-tRNA(Gln) amidotransferase subunit A